MGKIWQRFFRSFLVWWQFCHTFYFFHRSFISFLPSFFLSSWFFPFLLIFFLPSRPTVVLKLWLASHESGKSVWETFPFPNQTELQKLRTSLTFAFCEHFVKKLHKLGQLASIFFSAAISLYSNISELRRLFHSGKFCFN